MSRPHSLEGGEGGLNIAPKATVRSAAQTSPASTTISKPAGVAVGDLVLVILPDGAGAATLTTTSGSAWTRSAVLAWVAHGYQSTYWWKILDATDVANTWICSSSISVYSVAYTAAGFTGLNVRSTAANPISQSTLVVPGFDPAINSKGAIAIIIDRDTDTTSVAPTGFTKYAQVTISTWNISLANPTSDYHHDDITWTALLGGSSFAEAGWFLEVV